MNAAFFDTLALLYEDALMRALQKTPPSKETYALVLGYYGWRMSAEENAEAGACAQAPTTGQRALILKEKEASRHPYYCWTEGEFSMKTPDYHFRSAELIEALKVFYRGLAALSPEVEDAKALTLKLRGALITCARRINHTQHPSTEGLVVYCADRQYEYMFSNQRDFLDSISEAQRRRFIDEKLLFTAGGFSPAKR